MRLELDRLVELRLMSPLTPSEQDYLEALQRMERRLFQAIHGMDHPGAHDDLRTKCADRSPGVRPVEPGGPGAPQPPPR